jgi:hypothetical protein
MTDHKLTLISALEDSVFRLAADYRVADKEIAKLVLATITKAHKDRTDNPCAYCDCIYPCAKARSKDWD